MQKKFNKTRVMVLGSTGSIGIQTLEVIKANKTKFKVTGLSCDSSIELIRKQAEEFLPEAVSIIKDNPQIRESFNTKKIYSAEAGLLEMISENEADLVVNGISGSKGLLPSIKALESGKNLALANKETIVMAGKQVISLSKKNNVKIIPIDSEHAAIFQLIQNIPANNIEEIILTASGGPFLNREVNELKNVNIQDALNHPNWKMGKKITIDSATMANKGLEVIEAQLLFNFDISKIKVVIHPQSIIHSLVKTVDGCLYAQLSTPDMRIPIQNALTYPEILSNQYTQFELSDKTLSFLPVDYQKYKMLEIAYNAARAGGIYPIIFNAANEIAVEGFLQKKITFLQIPELVQKIIESEWKSTVATIEDILYIDKEIRFRTKHIIDTEFHK